MPLTAVFGQSPHSAGGKEKRKEEADIMHWEGVVWGMESDILMMILSKRKMILQRSIFGRGGPLLAFS